MEASDIAKAAESTKNIFTDIIDPNFAHDQRDVMKEYYSEYGFKIEETNKKIFIDKNTIHVADAKQ